MLKHYISVYYIEQSFTGQQEKSHHKIGGGALALNPQYGQDFIGTDNNVRFEKKSICGDFKCFFCYNTLVRAQLHHLDAKPPPENTQINFSGFNENQLSGIFLHIFFFFFHSILCPT